MISKLLILTLTAGAFLTAPADANRLRAKSAVVISEAPVDAPPLLPGVYEGSVGSWPQTTQPADVVDAYSCAVPATYCRAVIADWDAVHWDTIVASRKVGVVAYIAPTPAQYALGLVNPIDYVDIACDGGDWVRIEEPSLNSDTGEIEYWTTLSPAYFADGRHECRYKAVPEKGRAFVGQGLTINSYVPEVSLLINTNYNGTLPSLTRIVSPAGSDTVGCGNTLGNACRQVWSALDSGKLAMGSDVGGLTICLMAGDYQWGKPGQSGAIGTSFTYPSATQWVTVKACAGEDPALVRLTTVEGSTSAGGTLQPSGWRLQRVKLENLAILVGLQGSSRYGTRSGSTVPGQEDYWLNNVTCDNHVNCITGSKLKTLYGTNVTAILTGRVLSYGRLARNITVLNNSDDVFTNMKVILTASIAYVDRYPGSGHTDVWQVITNIRNAIIRGVTCNTHCAAQFWFSDATVGVLVDGFAFVNNDVTTIPSIGGTAVYILWQMGRPWSNGLLLNNNLTTTISMDSTSLVAKDWTFVNTVCSGKDFDASPSNAAQVTVLGGSGCTP